MTQNEIDTAVASSTGEDVSEIRRRGFNLIDPFDTNFDPEPDDLLPQMVDWDQLDRDRHVPMIAQRSSLLKRVA